MPETADISAERGAASRTAWFAGALAFCLALVVAATHISLSERDRRTIERARIQDMAADHASGLQRHLTQTLSATYALAALIRQGQGSIADFDAVAHEMLPFYPGVAALQLAPGGVVRRVVPLAGNEGAIGHDLLQDPGRNKEAVAARDTGLLTLAGPFELKQGGLGAVGRLPVFLDAAHGRRSFWGFTNVLLRFPQTLAAANLPELGARAIAYELWRTDPGTGRKQVIAASSADAIDSPVDQSFHVANATWTLSIAPLSGWGDPFGLSYKAAMGLLFAVLLGHSARQLTLSRARRLDLERLIKHRTAELAEREADLARAQAVAQVGSWAFDVGAAQPPWTVSRETYRILGLPEGTPLSYEELIKKVYAPDRASAARAWRSVLGGARTGVECRIEVNGKLRWIRTRAELLHRDDGPDRFVGTLQDITDLKQAEQALRIAATAFETREGIVIADERGIIQQVNRAFAEITGLSSSSVVGQHTRILQSGHHDAAFYEAMWQRILSSGSWAGEVWNRRVNGELYPAWLTITAVLGDRAQVTHYVGTLVDITQRKAAEEEIAHLAYYDPLTRLPNRRMVTDRIQQALTRRARSGNSGAVLFIDLDHFKALNDTHGHARGDQLLQQVAQRLVHVVRDGDTAARMGGDEFVVLLEGLSPDYREARTQAHAVALMILAKINEAYTLGELTYRISPSIGFTVFDSRPVSVAELLRQADVAMYQAKAEGRGRALAFEPAGDALAPPQPPEPGLSETTW